jgi:hypothetical protein
MHIEFPVCCLFCDRAMWNPIATAYYSRMQLLLLWHFKALCELFNEETKVVSV